MLIIVIPYFKKAFFKETLDSLAKQSDKNFIVFIGDDASSENCLDLLEEYRNHFEYYFHRFEINIGGKSLVRQWQRCIDLVPVHFKEWIMILGDDDVLDDNVVEMFNYYLNDIRSLKVNVVRFSSVVIDKFSRVISNNYIHPKIEDSKDSFFRKLNNLTRNSLSEQVFNFSELKMDLDFIETDYGLYSDDLLILDHANDNKIFSINEAFVKIRKSDQNLSGGVLKLKNRNNAFYQFYLKLIKSTKISFTMDQMEVIYDKFERGIFNYKDIRILFFLTFHYIINNNLIRFLKLYCNIFLKLPKMFFKIYEK
jgi:glycosyltransferase involved in cell wall biosynthesis